jgi:hypothetical protein
MPSDFDAQPVWSVSISKPRRRKTGAQKVSQRTQKAQSPS